MKNKLAFVLMIVGALLMLTSVGMTLYQDYEETTANETVTAVAVDVQEALRQNAAFISQEPQPTPQQAAQEPPAATAAPAALAAPATTAAPAGQEPVQATDTPAPAPVTDNVQTMPLVYVDGKAYIGMLSIPSLELELPIQNEWSYAKLKKTPCHYTGTVIGRDMVIIAHNYDRHFGRLKTLETGDSVLFTDANGKVYRYQVDVLETLKPNQNDYLVSGAWDLSLSTCTIGGRERTVVRCRLTDDSTVP